MLTATDPALVAEYSCSIIAGMCELLDGFEARLPRMPDSCVWEGLAKTQYAVELEALRDSLAILRHHLGEVRRQLAGAGSYG